MVKFNPQIKVSYVIVVFLLLILMMGYTLYNINGFMKSEKKCESGFSVISKCGCFPDDNFAKLFGFKDQFVRDFSKG